MKLFALIPTCALLLLLGLTSGCVSSDDYGRLQSRADSLAYELQMEGRLNDQLQEYIEEVCYPRVEPSLRRANSNLPLGDPATSPPDTLPQLAMEKVSEEHLYLLDREIRFNPTSVELNDGGIEALQLLADSVRLRDDLQILVVGHCDNEEENAPSDPYEDSWKLSTARAEVVVRNLIAMGVSPQYLIAAGRGRFYPVASNRSDEGKKANRRVEIFIRTRAALP